MSTFPLDSSSAFDRIGFFFALEAEGLEFVRRLGLDESRPFDAALPARYFEGSVGDAGMKVAVAFAGIDPEHRIDRIGTASATLTAYLLCRRFDPGVLINAGTCGGFRSAGAEIGSIYVGVDAFLFHDHWIPLPGFDSFGVGRIPAAPPEEIVRLLDADRGVVSSGDSFETNEREMEFFRRENVVAKDMEAAAVARVATDLRIPFVAVKAVTDLVDHPEPGHEAFERNLARVSDLLQSRLVGLLDGLHASRTGDARRSD